MTRLRDLHRDIEASVPHVDSVESLVNTRVTRGDGNDLVVEDLLERWPETQADLDRIREIASANPLYENVFVSRDGRHAMIAIAMIGVVLALLFRRASGVVLPLVTALFSLACVMGAMAMLDLPLTPISQVFPALLLAIGIAGPVHLLVIFYPLYDAGASRMYSLVLIPAFLSIVEVRRRPPSHQSSDRINRVLAAMGTYSTRHPWSVITVWARWPSRPLSPPVA